MANRRDHIVIVDTGSLLRLSAAGLLDALSQAGRLAILVDMVELAACRGQPNALLSRDIAEWLEQAGSSVARVETFEGIALKALEKRPNADEGCAALDKLRRDGAAHAVRSFIEQLEPGRSGTVLVVHEHPRMCRLLRATPVPVHLMTTLFFLQALEREGFGVKVDAAMEAIANVPLTLAPAEERLLRPPTAVAAGA